VKGKGRKQARICVSDSDSDDQAPVSKKIKLLGELSLNIQGIRKDLSTIFTLTKGMKLPPGLHTLLYNTFKCNICHSSPMTPPSHDAVSVFWVVNVVLISGTVGKMDEPKVALCAGRSVPSPRQ